jgi:WD40 repeat protein
MRERSGASRALLTVSLSRVARWMVLCGSGTLAPGMPFANLHCDSGVLGVALAADRDDIVGVGGNDGTVRVADINTQQSRVVVKVHAGGVPGVAFPRTGEYFPPEALTGP